MGSWGRSQMKMKWKAKVQFQQLHRKNGTADNKKACRNTGSKTPLEEATEKPRGWSYRKGRQQIRVVGLLTAIETQVSLCDLSARCLVPMASLRCVWEGRLQLGEQQVSPWLEVFAQEGTIPTSFTVQSLLVLLQPFSALYFCRKLQGGKATSAWGWTQKNEGRWHCGRHPKTLNLLLRHKGSHSRYL